MADTPKDLAPSAATQDLNAFQTYAESQNLFDLGSRLFEPYVNHRVQQHFARQGHYKAGTYMQNLAGEIAGDVVGIAALTSAERLFPKQMQRTTDYAEQLLDPIYDPLAEKLFEPCCDDKNYDQRVDEWKKDQQAELIHAGVAASASVTGNVFAQKKIFRNPAASSAIFKGKMASTSLTTLLGLSMGFALPGASSFVDTLVNEKTQGDLENAHNPTAHNKRER